MNLFRGMIVVVFVYICASTSFADLVSNGDFKSNASDFVDSPGTAGAGSNPSAISDWSTASIPVGQALFGVGGDGVSYAPVNQRGPTDHQGNTYAFIQNTGAGSGLLQQHLPSMLTGSKYSLSFGVAARSGETSKGFVQVADADQIFLRVGFAPPNDQFRNYQRSFVAPGAFSGTPFIQLVNEKGNSTLAFTSLSITAIPEPSSCVILAACVVGFWTRQIKRRK